MKKLNDFSKRKSASTAKNSDGKLLKNFDSSSDGDIYYEQFRILMNELQVFRLELEMQNDELKVSYQALDEEKSKFVSLYDLAPVGYFILDYLGLITDVNEQGVDLLKSSKENVLSKRFQSFISPESWEKFYSFLHKIQNSDSRQSIEIKLLLSNNEIAYTRVEGIAVQNVISTHVKYFIAVIDITESRKAQLKLQETMARLEMTLSASSTGTWTIDSFDNRVSLDEHSYVILDLKPWEFDGSIQQFIQLVHPDDHDKMRKELTNGVTFNEEVDIEFRVLTKNGEVKYISSKGHEVTSSHNEGKCFAGILIDITERKRLSQEAEDLRIDQQRVVLSATLLAQEKERMRISSALHDSVCQILYGIKLNLQNFQLTNKLNKEFVNVNQLLDQAILETRQISYELTPSVLKDFGFTAGIKEMAQRLSTSKFLIKTKIKNTADLLHPKVQLYLFRIIQELINNSIKHSNANTAEIKVNIDKEIVSLVVSDNGKGFSTNVEELFKKGSGLRGIKNRVFLLDGTIDFQSTSKGTTILIKFKNDFSLSAIESI